MNTSNNVNISVLYFASLADKAGIDEEMMAVASDDLIQIYHMLSDKYHFDLSKDKLSVAVNHHFVDWQTKVREGDIIAFIPPVAGG